jgi:tRNA(Arg) A34 adenosine deaminase TadA
MAHNHSQYMRLAIAKAREGVRKGQTPFGACIVRDGQVLSCTHNHVWKNTDITAHAEIQAIREACHNSKTVDLSGSVIYSTCEPCPMCFSACHWARISMIVYGTTIADAKRIGFNELTVSNAVLKRAGHSPVKIKPAYLRKESLELFNFWLNNPSRKAY